MATSRASSSGPPSQGKMDIGIVEVGLSSRPLSYVQDPPPPPPQQFDSEKVPQSLVLEVRPFLRVANQVEAEAPRVAYLCRFHALEKAISMDPRSTGRGVRLFKTALLQRLEQDANSTESKRTKKSDAREIKSFYEKKKQANEHELLPVLAEVLKALFEWTGLENVMATSRASFSAPPNQGEMEIDVVEVGLSSCPLRYVQRPPPPPLPPPPQQSDSEKIPQSLLSEIGPFLRVANQVEAESPRVAYFCRFHALDKAHSMDPHATGRGVRQFKTALLQRLEQDANSTEAKRTQKNDAREIKSFYIKKKQDNEQELLPVLSEVLKALFKWTDLDLEKLVATEDYVDPSGLLRYDGGSKSGRRALCPVCLDDVQDGEMVRQLSACRHLFHVKCIDMWLHSHSTCPLCRCDVGAQPGDAKPVRRRGVAR